MGTLPHMLASHEIYGFFIPTSQGQGKKKKVYMAEVFLKSNPFLSHVASPVKQGLLKWKIKTPMFIFSVKRITPIEVEVRRTRPSVLILYAQNIVGHLSQVSQLKMWLRNSLLCEVSKKCIIHWPHYVCSMNFLRKQWIYFLSFHFSVNCSKCFSGFWYLWLYKLGKASRPLMLASRDNFKVFCEDCVGVVSSDRELPLCLDCHWWQARYIFLYYCVDYFAFTVGHYPGLINKW